MSLNGVIARFFTHATLTVTRRAAPTLAGGIWTDGATSTVTLTRPSVQPYTGPAIKVGPEGTILEDVRTVYTTTQLNASPGYEDTIVIDGSTYTVIDCKPYGTISGGHWVAVVARKTTP